MSDFKKMVVIRGCKLLHYLVSVALFGFCWYSITQTGLGIQGFLSPLSTILLYAIALLMLLRIYRAYDIVLSSTSENVYSQSLSQLLSILVICLLCVLNGGALQIVLPMGGLLLLQIAFNTLWSNLTKRLYFRFSPPAKTVVVYRGRSDLHRLEEALRREKLFDVRKYIESPDDDIHALLAQLHGYDVIFVAGINAALRNGLAKYCVENNITGYFAPHVGDIIISGSRHLTTFSVPILQVNRSRPTPEYLFIKRAMDIICSLLGIILTSPLMLLTALAIKLYDGGPVLYKQVRLTKNGRNFNIMKFRSMRTDAENDGVARLATENDDRITPVGKVIRACRLDELPQLFNILKGEMTIVGPRPERPEISARYEETLHAFSLRLQVKAGLTGYAQVYGRYNTDPYDKLQMDLMYINRMSLSQDLKLILATVKILFMKESTTGVDEEQKDALHV